MKRNTGLKWVNIFYYYYIIIIIIIIIIITIKNKHSDSN